MSPRLKWAVVAAGWYGLILAGRDYIHGPAELGAGALKLTYGLGFLGLGVAVLGTLARWFPRLPAAEWRVLTIATSALLAAIAVALAGGGWSGRRTDLWVAALLGVGVAAVASRGLPARWLELARARRRQRERLRKDRLEPISKFRVAILLPDAVIPAKAGIVRP